MRNISITAPIGHRPTMFASQYATIPSTHYSSTLLYRKESSNSLSAWRVNSLRQSCAYPKITLKSGSTRIVATPQYIYIAGVSRNMDSCARVPSKLSAVPAALERRRSSLILDNSDSGSFVMDATYHLLGYRFCNRYNELSTQLDAFLTPYPNLPRLTSTDGLAEWDQGIGGVVSLSWGINYDTKRLPSETDTIDGRYGNRYMTCSPNR